MEQTQAKKMNKAKIFEGNENETIQNILDKCGLFPCRLYEIEHVNIIRKLINMHPAMVYLIYKIATTEKSKEIIKFPIPIYRIKRNWHTALKHFKRLEIVDFKDIEIHSIEPHKAILTPFGRFVTKKWLTSPLFKAFEVFDTLNFKSTYHFELIFNDNFIAYKGRKGNVLYNETQKIYHKSNLISKTKTKNAIKITIDSGFSNVKYDYYIEERKYNKLVMDDITLPINLEESNLLISVQPHFKDLNFEISILYDANFIEGSFDVQNCIDLTDIIVERRKRKILFRNLSRTKNKAKKKQKFKESPPISSSEIQSVTVGFQTPETRVESGDIDTILLQQTGITGTFDTSQISEINSKKVKESIENSIREYQAREEELLSVYQEDEQLYNLRRQQKTEHFRRIQFDREKRGEFYSFIQDAFEEITRKYIEDLSVKLDIRDVQQILCQQFLKFYDPLSLKDAKFYSNMFEEYLARNLEENFVGYAMEIKKKRKKREEELVKELQLDYFRAIESIDLKGQNELHSSDGVQTYEQKIKPQVEQVDAFSTIPQPSFSRYLKSAGKVVIKNFLWFLFGGFVLYFLFYNITTQSYVFFYKSYLMLPLDWELPIGYVYAKFPEMELVSHLVGIIGCFSPLVLSLLNKTISIEKEYQRSLYQNRRRK